jgi:dTDP-4-amino-4,6-dideoxygalactose transaminase
MSVAGHSGQLTLLDAPTALLTTSGRAAIALALRELGISAGDEVLVPAYHCAAVTAPIRASGALATSYRMDAKLGFNIEDVQRRISTRTRAIVVVHFFGFPQPLAELRTLCDQRGLALIEDCAHLFHGPGGSTPVGATGDFSIGSLMKFLPVFDGGCLVSHRRQLRQRPALRGGGAMYQLKALSFMLERAGRWSDFAPLRMLANTPGLVSRLLKRTSRRMARNIAAQSPAASYGSVEFEARWVDATPAAATRLVVRHANHSRSVGVRRAHYQAYLKDLSSVAGGTPFQPTLPEGVVPYVFPFLLTNPEAQFPALRRAGVPMYRWEDVDAGTCDVSRDYRWRLVQFPCHQSLTGAQVQMLVETIRSVLRTDGIAVGA